MKDINSNNSILDKILPTIGTYKSIKTPIWNESQHMFITDQYTSANGNTYYLGVRVSDKFVSVLHFGLFHNWTYINDIEVYAFDGMERVLIGKTTLDTYYNEDLVRSTTEKLLTSYLESQIKLTGSVVSKEIIDAKVKDTIDKSYCSLINDKTVLNRLEAIKPLLADKIN